MKKKRSKDYLEGLEAGDRRARKRIRAATINKGYWIHISSMIAATEKPDGRPKHPF